MKKEVTYTFTSPLQIVQVFNNHPSLNNIPSLSALNLAIKENQKPKKKGCKNCPKEEGGIRAIDIRAQTQIAMANMSSSDYAKVKEILKIDKLCYFEVDSNGKSKQICI